MQKQFLTDTVRHFRHMKQRTEQAVDQLTVQELHWRPNDESNNIAIIIKHLSGNMHSRWVNFLTSDGEKDYRDRDSEFIDDIESKEQLLEKWEAGWRLLFNTIEHLKEEDLLKTVTIRSRSLTVFQAIQIELQHISYHLGQIVSIGKQIKGNEWTTLSIPRGQSNTFH